MFVFNINGERHTFETDEEFRNFTRSYGGDPFAGFGRGPRVWDGKSHIFQCYKKTIPNKWIPILSDELYKDTGVKPKYIGQSPFTFEKTESGEYEIFQIPAVCIFWNHDTLEFMYAKNNGIVKEKDLYSTQDDAMNAIRDVERQECGKTRLYSQSGTFIKEVVGKK